MLRELYDYIITLTVYVQASQIRDYDNKWHWRRDNDDDADRFDNVDDSYSGDQHAYNAPKVGVLLDSIILSTGPTKVLLDT